MICFLFVFLKLVKFVLAMGFVKGQVSSYFFQGYGILQTDFFFLF